MQVDNSVVHEGQKTNPENVTKETIAKYVNALIKFEDNQDGGPDICDDVNKISKFNKKLEFDNKEIKYDTRKFIEKYFKEPPDFSDVRVPFPYEENIFDDIKISDIDVLTKEHILMSVDLFKSLLSPYQIIPASKFSSLIKIFCETKISPRNRYVESIELWSNFNQKDAKMLAIFDKCTVL